MCATSASAVFPRLNVILLCGLPGSGKTTIAQRILEIDPTIIRICQDELGDRRACENRILQLLARQYYSALQSCRPSLLMLSGPSGASSTTDCTAKSSEPHSGRIQNELTILVDRTNFDQQQRRTWISMAHAFGGRACAIQLQVPFNTCAQRIRQRSNHPKAVHGNEGVDILYRYFRNCWRDPDARREGLTSILTLSRPRLDWIESEGFRFRLERDLLKPLRVGYRNQADMNAISHFPADILAEWKQRLQITIDDSIRSTRVVEERQLIEADIKTESPLAS